jgi:ATP-dependent Lhr-like helicase
VPILRRLEARGEIRGGRFVSGPFGEQYALPEAAEALREARKRYASARETQSNVETQPIAVAATDPLNLVGILVPGERVTAAPGNHVLFVNGCAPQDEAAPGPPKKMSRARTIADLLRNEAVAARPAAQPASQNLFA